MSHEAFHELLALRLYGEIDAKEGERLASHLAGCAACRHYAVELERGLGRVRAGVHAGTQAAGGAVASPSAVPDDWRIDLASKIRTRTLRARAWPWLTAAAGFAAGLGLALALAGRAPDKPDRIEVAERAAFDPPTAYAAFKRATPPPLASSEGPFTRLGAYLRQ